MNNMETRNTMIRRRRMTQNALAFHWSARAVSPCMVYGVLLVSCAMVMCVPNVCADKQDRVDFNRDIRPLLSDRCFHCHGPDEQAREAGFRLDQPKSAYGEADSGEHPIVPGAPEASEMMARTSAKDDSLMPPRDSNKPQLTSKELELIRRWILEGAHYERHWGFVPPKSHVPPKTDEAPVKVVDAFVDQQLVEAGLPPNEPASPATFLRRVTFDLTGLPPSPEELDEFEVGLRESESPEKAYEEVVTRLLASPRFGENMARVWLDAARYADSNGYLQNPYRVSWPWRDWVVRAFNENMSYDRFVTEMLAGDLVPDANEQSRLATAFLRMHMITSEGGSLDDEFRIEYAADRAETVGTVFMGITMNCCRCHDHKYDPFGQKDYYQLLAMLADPKGEDPVKDHSHEPAFPPILRLNKSDYSAESERLDRAAKTALAAGNADSAQRLGIQNKMLKEGLPVMVMEENPKLRQFYVLDRGSYASPDEKRPVKRGAVDPLLAWDETKFPRDRLGLAKWLTDPGHPLTARVEVNRIWTLFFGRGLVGSQEDFGSQSVYPSHPKLLDTLAVRFRESGWDRKALIRTLVTSETYRRSSMVAPRHRQTDPENLLLARMNRRRLPAEAIRDQALFVSGQLVTEMGGHPALPYQPSGLWREGANSPDHQKGKLVMTGSYERSSGDELRRRSLYTFWNRNAPPPQMQIFDAPGRSYSAVSRAQTNTPLQALVTMNDIQFTEAARFLAERTLSDTKLTDDLQRIDSIYLRCTGRRLEPADRTAFGNGLALWRASFTAAPENAKALLASSGEKPRGTDIAAPEHAAWMMLANTVFNLDASLVLD